MAYRVLIPQDVAEEGKKYLRDRGHEIVMGTGITPEILSREIAACDAVLVRTAILSADVIGAAPRLKAIAKHGVGLDNIDLDAATRRGVYVMNAPESNSRSVAEQTFGLILACVRGLVRCDTELRNGNFEIRNQLNGYDLIGKTLGIVGIGRIGSIVAWIARHGFSMNVIACDPNVSELPGIPDLTTCPLDDLLAQSDIVTLHVPAKPDTIGMIGAAQFETMKDTAYLFNAARGQIVDEEALVGALRSGSIAGAGIDVFETEPPAHDHPLFSLPNVVVQPHSAALTRESTVRMALHAAMGIDDVLSGRTPKWPANDPVPERHL